ncbi:MAG TPA: histidine triad nucleotide-binding protein [Gemmatimonadaceae bacterium]|nr:histidine triad nucleotide-binding protein [Gemmatimonadaceae bacterium]
MAEPCLFCRIVRREIPAGIVHETEDVVAFRDIHPQAPVHVLIIPKTHVHSLDRATDAAMIGKLSLAAAEIARAKGIAEDGYRTVMNTGPGAGQTVFHVHLHLLGGRKFDWPPG